jgi:hypothetical protein
VSPGGQFGSQIADFVRHLGGSVVMFADIFANIEQFAAAVFVPLDQLPVAIAERTGRGAPPDFRNGDSAKKAGRG